jgi:hypothetical protein
VSRNEKTLLTFNVYDLTCPDEPPNLAPIPKVGLQPLEHIDSEYKKAYSSFPGDAGTYPIHINYPLEPLNLAQWKRIN